MAIEIREWLNEEDYLDITEDRKIMHIGDADIDVTDSMIEYDRIFGVEKTNNFWSIYYSYQDKDYCSYYSDNKLVYKGDYESIMLEKNGYLRVVDTYDKKSIVFDIEGRKLMESDSTMLYYNVIDGTEIAISFTEVLKLEINSKEYIFKNRETIHVNSQNELCIIGDNYNAAYDFQLNKIRDLAEHEIKEYKEHGYLYDID